MTIIKKWTIQYIKNVPVSLCIRELNRLIAFNIIKDEYHLSVTRPILDIGCGDGFWWTLQEEYNKKDIFGIDIEKKLVKEAKKYIQSEVCDISQNVPFGGKNFDLIVGNCSLEHIKNINKALENIAYCASSENSTLVLIVPTTSWAYQGIIQQFLLKNFPRISMAISGALNGFFQHWHLYDYEVWSSILQKAGWEVKNGYGLGNKRSEFLFRLFLPTGFIGFIIKSIFGNYPNKVFKILPDFLLSPFLNLMEWALKNPIVDKNDKHAYELIIVAKKCLNQ